MPKLVNLGSLCIDHVYRVASLAGPGETIASQSHQVFPGGKGLNQSLAAARAGAEVLHFGCIGSDGQLLIDTLSDAGVGTEGIRRLDDQVSGHAVIQVDDSGANAIVIAGGANRSVTATDREAAWMKLNTDDWLLAQNEINDLEEILTRARALPGRLALNLAPVDGREQNYDLAAVDLLIVNEIEARVLVSADIAAEDDDAVVGSLAQRYPGMDVVLTAGDRGLVHARGSERQRLSAHPVAAVDQTAAGDAFIGYLLAGLLAGVSFTEALEYGSAAGALAVTAPGAASSIPEREAVADLLRGRSGSRS